MVKKVLRALLAKPKERGVPASGSSLFLGTCVP